MADIFSKKKRSWVMSRVKSKNTAPERLVFRHLRSKGIYFQKHYRHIAGSPDIAIPSKKIAIFINGDFWHGRHYQVNGHKLTNFWKKKIETNIARDRRNRMKLRRAGWRILNIWGSDLKKREFHVLHKIVTFLKQA